MKFPTHYPLTREEERKTGGEETRSRHPWSYLSSSRPGDARVRTLSSGHPESLLVSLGQTDSVVMPSISEQDRSGPFNMDFRKSSVSSSQLGCNVSIWWEGSSKFHFLAKTYRECSV